MLVIVYWTSVCVCVNTVVCTECFLMCCVTLDLIKLSCTLTLVYLATRWKISVAHALQMLRSVMLCCCFPVFCFLWIAWFFLVCYVYWSVFCPQDTCNWHFIICERHILYSYEITFLGITLSNYNRLGQNFTRRCRVTWHAPLQTFAALRQTNAKHQQKKITFCKLFCHQNNASFHPLNRNRFP